MLPNPATLPSLCPGCRASIFPQELVPGTHGVFCAACKKVWLRDEDFCHLVGTHDGWPEERAAVIPSEVPCPICPKAFFHRVSTPGGVQWMRCPGCHGVWLTLPAIEMLSHAAELEKVEAQEQKNHEGWGEETAALRSVPLESFPTAPGMTEADPEFPPYSTPAPVGVIRPEEIGPPPRVPSDWLVVEASVLPLSVVMSWMVYESSFLPLKALLGAVRLGLHGLGQTLLALASSHLALSLPAGLTVLTEERSALLYLVGLAAPTWLGVFSMKRQWPFLTALVVAFLGLQIYCNFLRGAGHWEELYLMAGVGGEMALATVAMLAYFYRFPDAWRWDFWRFIVLPVATYVLVANATQWLAILHHQAEIPWGTLLLGTGDKAGDMNRLVSEYGWTADELAGAFVQLAGACAAMVLSHYLFFVTRALVMGRSRK